MILKLHQTNLYKLKGSTNFSNEPVLEYHIESVHEGKKLHQCSKCDMSFTTLGGFNHHQESVHEKSGNYESLDLESKEEVKDLVDIEKENGMKQPMLKIRVSMGF